MGDSNAIRAGRAQVEASLDDAGLAAGLARAQARLQAFGQTIRTVAAAAGIGLSFAALGAAINAYADRGTHLLHEAEQVGASVEFMSGLSLGLQSLGGDADSATQAIFRFNNKLTAAIQGSAEAQRAFQMLGIDASDLNNMTTDERMDKLSEAFQAVESHAEKSRIAMQLFGRGGREMLEALSRQGGLRGLREEMQKLGLVMSQEQAEKARDLHKSLSLLQASGMSLLNAVLEPMIPTIRSVVDGMAEAARTVRDVVRAFGNGDWGLGFQIACKTAELAWMDFVDAVTRSIPGLQAAFGAIAEPVRRVLVGLAQFRIGIQGLARGESLAIISDAMASVERHSRADQRQAEREGPAVQRQRLVDELARLRARLVQPPERRLDPDIITSVSGGARGTFNSAIAPQLAAPADPMLRMQQRNLDEVIRARVQLELIADQIAGMAAMTGPLVFQ